MPNEPKADWEKEARELCDGPLNERTLATALREAHAAGAREAEEKRHPGSEPPDTARDVLVNHRGQWRVMCWSDGKWDFCGYEYSAPDFWLELPDASRVGGKETK